MNKTLIIVGSIILVLIIAVIGIGLYVMGIFNGEVRLKNTFEAKKKHIETAHDTMWKTLAQQYQIHEGFRETFLQGIQAISEGRKGGGLFKSNTESNAQPLGLSTETFNKMMASIEGQRASLKREQDTLADMWRAHKTFCEVMPNSIFIGGRVLPEPKMITSSRTQDAVETGRDDHVQLGTEE